jgi:pimeloyl-ACP methyl ester carboxylesterase
MSAELAWATSADGVPIAYDARGDGATALVFVHGWAGRRQHWDEQVEWFTPDHRVVRLDLAGHGASGDDRRRWSIHAFADDVVAVVDDLGLDRVVLIGHSLGGSVIIDAARSLGRRVVGLVGIDTWSSLGVRRSVQELEESVLLPQMRANFDAGARAFAAIMAGPTAPAALAARVADETASMAPHIAISILEDAIANGPDAIEEALRDLEVPRSAISSATFRPKDPSVLEGFLVEHVVLPGTGHYLMLERPGEFNILLARAISRSDLPPPRP